jgi:UDP-glucose 4-epimerase
MKTVLVTGAHGFLGRNTALFFKNKDFRVVGIGLGNWESEESKRYGIDTWFESSVNLSVMHNLKTKFDVIVHCAGASSVGYSFAQPFDDFDMTVNTTISVLEYMRLYNQEAKLVYPSSAAVYGIKDDWPIKENDSLDPVSPYGHHKKIAEELCKSYSDFYGINVTIIRFFSLYGNGLRKQLLWDACWKFNQGKDQPVFFGTGEEIRDWMHISDATKLIYAVLQSKDRFQVYNGGSGKRIAVKEIIHLMASALEQSKKITFNGITKEGDPKYYIADIAKALTLKWKPEKIIAEGINEYAEWFKRELENGKSRI